MARRKYGDLKLYKKNCRIGELKLYIKMSINQGFHFQYRDFTKSFLYFFDKVPVLETVISS